MSNLEADNSDPEDERTLIEKIRRMSFGERVAQWNALTQAHREQILSDLRKQYPQADEQELRKRFAARVLPREIVIRMFDWDPEKEGY